MHSFWKIVAISFLVYFLSWLAVYKTGINNLAIQSEDTLPALFLPVTIIKEGTPYVDSYYDMLIKSYPHPDDKSFEKGLTPFYLRKVGDHYISAFPLITGLLALPVYAIPLLSGMQITWENLTILGHISGALIAAFSGGFLYLLLRKAFSLDGKKAQILTAVYLFATVNYALVSQALWQHGTVQLFLILALIFAYKKNWFFSSLMFALAVLSRPTAAIVFPLFVLLAVFIEFGNRTDSASDLAPVSAPRINLQDFIRFALTFFLGFLPPVLFFLWYNSAFYLDIGNQGYSGQILTGWLSKFPGGFLGLWFSPSKGILVYSPVFIFSFVGLYIALFKESWRKNSEFIFFALVVFTHTLILGSWKHWYGGWSFGYRMASDIIPFLILLMVPFIKSPLFDGWKKHFYLLFGFSVLVQLFGIVFFDGIWHSAYDRGFMNTFWLWSVRDSELFFNIRRVMVKLGVLGRACPQCLPN